MLRVFSFEASSYLEIGIYMIITTISVAEVGIRGGPIKNLQIFVNQFGELDQNYKMHSNKNREVLNEQNEDVNLDGRFGQIYEKQTLSPKNNQYYLYSNEVSLPPINKKSNGADRDRLKTESYIRQIYQTDDQPVKILKIQQSTKRTLTKSPKNSKPIRSDIIDLRKQQKNGCGSKKCKICNPEQKLKPVKTHRKQRLQSMPASDPNNKIERIIVSRALETHKKQRKPKVTHVQELNDDGVFRLVPKQEKRPKRIEIIEDDSDDDLGRTFYQEMNINGKVYLVKKKKKRVSDLKKSIVRVVPEEEHISPRKILYFSQANEDNQQSVRKSRKSKLKSNKVQYYRVNSQNRSKDSESIIVVKKDDDDEEEYISLEEERIKRQKEEEMKRNEEERKIREELNEQTRRYIHQKTYYQDQQAIGKMKKQYDSPQRMRLNTTNTEESDVERINVFDKHSRNSSIDLVEKRRFENNFQNSERIRTRYENDDERYNIKFPEVNEVNNAIKNYRPLTKHIDVFTLKKSPNFIREYNDEPGKEFFYFGQFDNTRKLRHGKGVLCTKNRVLQGVWKNGELVDGAELKQNGLYKGTFLNGKKNGEGSYEWVNGQKYIGEWKEGKRHGRGQWTSRKGDIYMGDWKNGKATGSGEFVTKDDGIYRGEFKNFVKHGFGKHNLPNGDIYVGDFWEGYPNGEGKYQWRNGLVYEGTFNDAVREGKGHLYREQIFELDGDFKNDLPHGICRCKIGNGDIFTGKYSYGDRSGYGNYENRDLQKSNVVPISYWSSKSIARKNQLSNRQQW